MNRRYKLAVFIVAMASASLARADIQDLGTLGGSASSAWDINDNGQVVGWADTAMDGRHAFLWTAENGMLDLGTLGGPGSRAWAVNEEGQVVGEAFTSEIVNNAFTTHAFSWTAAGGMIDLGTLGGTNSYALAVSENGQVVGYSQLPTGETHAFSWTATGGMLDLGALTSGPSSFSKALAVNDAGRVIGETRNDSFEVRSFSWIEGNAIEDLGTLFGTYAYARALNNSGQVVGVADTSQSLGRAFLWTDAGGMVDLGTLTGTFVSSSSAWAITDSGQVVGDSETLGFATHAMSWTEAGGMVDLGLPPGASSSSARAVNDGDQIVGDAEMSTGDIHAFSWTAAGGIVDLGTLGGNFTYARAVNNNGQVVGESQTLCHVTSRAVLWQQIPSALTGIVALPNIGGSAAPDIGVAVPGSTNVQVRDGMTDALISDVGFGDDGALQMMVLPDLNASGFPEIAMLQEQASGHVRVQIKDSLTGDLVRNLWYGKQYDPVRMAIVPDYSGNGDPEIAVLGSEAGTDAVRVQIHDSDGGGVLDNVFLGTQSIAIDLVAVKDTSGNAIPEVGILGVLKCNAQVRSQLWDSASAVFQDNVWFGNVYQPQSMITMPDINSNGSDEIVAMGVDPVTDNIRLQVRDSDTTATLYNIWLGAVNEAVDIALINDINSDGVADLAVLLKTPAGTGRVRVQSGSDGAFIRNLFYTVVEKPVGLAVMLDYSGNGFDELATLGESAGVRHVQILDTMTGSQVNRIDYP